MQVKNPEEAQIFADKKYKDLRNEFIEDFRDLTLQTFAEGSKVMSIGDILKISTQSHCVATTVSSTVGCSEVLILH